MKKIRFIVNPISGVGRQKVIEQLVSKKLNKNKFEFDIVYTKYPKHATELSSEAAKQKIDIVVAVGGDGSVNEVSRGLIGTSTVMAIMPAGSGNGLARHLKIPMNLVKAMQIINLGNETIIDTVKINDETFVGMAGVGFDAHIGWEFSKFGKRGFQSYLKVILREYPKYKCSDFELEIDGKKIQRNAFLISFANGSQYGNNAYIAPKALLNDGVVDICIMKRFPLRVVPHLVYRLFNQTMHECNFLETFQGREIILKQDCDIAHIDGEPIKLGKEMRIKINPLSLKVIAP